MLGKNNFKERLRQMEDQNKKERFSIRKLSIGAASVLIGFAFMGLGVQSVQADEVMSGAKPAAAEVKTASDNSTNNQTEQKEKPQVAAADAVTKNEQVNQTAKNDESSLTVKGSAVKVQPETQVKTSNEKKDDASQLVTDKAKDVVTSSKETQTNSTADAAAKPKIGGDAADKKQAEQKSDAEKTDTEAKANEVAKDLTKAAADAEAQKTTVKDDKDAAKADETGTVNDVHVTSAADDLEAAMKKAMDLEDLTSGHKLTTDQVSQIDAILEKGQALLNRYYAAQVDGKKITSILRSNPTDGGSTTGNNETEGHESQTFDPSQFANVSHDLNSLLTNLQVNNTYLNNGSFSQTISTDDDFRRAVTDSTTTAIYLTHDISISSSIEDAKNDLTIYGQGHILTFSNYCSIVTSNASLGFDNVTIDASNRPGCINDTAVADGLSVSFNNVIFKNLTGRFISGINVNSSSVSFTGANKIESANNSANSPIFRGENLTINGSLVSDSPLPIPLYYGRGLTINGTLKASYNYNNEDPFIYVWNRPLEMNRGITFGSNSQVDIKGNGSSALGLGSNLDSPMPFTIYTGAKVNIDAGDTTPIRFLGNTDVDIDLQGNSELNISGKNGVLQRERGSSFGKLSISADSGSSLKINTTGNQDSTLTIYAQNPKLISLKTQNGNFDTSKVTFDTNQNAGLYLKSDTEEGSWKVSGIQGSVGNGTIISRAGFWGKTPLAEVPTKGDSSEYKYSSEDEYHEITRGNSFNDLVYSADESQTALQSYSGRYNATSDVVTVHAISGGTEKLGDASSYIHITNSSIQPSASGYNVNNDDTNVIRGIKWIKGVITESSHNAFDPTNPHSNPVSSQAGAITVDANGDVTLNTSVGTVGINGSNATIAVTYHDGSIDYVPVKLNVVSAEVKHGNTDPSQPNSQNNPIYLNIKTPDDSDAENVISNTDQLSQWHPTYEFTDDQGNPISEFGSGTDISGDNSHKLIQTNVKVSYKNATDPNVADGYQIVPVFIRVNKTLADQYSDDVKAKNNFKVLDGSQTSLQNDAKAALDITIPASDPQPTVTWAVNPTVQTDGSYKGTVNVVFTDPTDNSTSSFTRDITYHVIAKAVSKTDQNAITFNEDGTNVATPSITIKNGENEGQDLLNWNGRSEPEGQSYSVSGLIYIHDHPDLLEPTEVQHQNANVQVQLADNNTYTGGQNDVTLANGHKVYNVSVALIIPSDAANHHPGTVDPGRHPVNPEDPDGQQFYVDGDNVYVHVNGTVPAVDQVVKVTDGQGQAVASGADTYTISGWNVPSTATAGDHAEQLTINYHDGTRATLDLNVHVIGGNGADLTHTVYGGTTSPAAKNQISNNSDLASKFGDNISYSWYKDADGTTAMTNADFNTVTTAGNSDNAWIKINWGDGTSEMVGIKLNLTSAHVPDNENNTPLPRPIPVTPGEDPSHITDSTPSDPVPGVDPDSVPSGSHTRIDPTGPVPDTTTPGSHPVDIIVDYPDGTHSNPIRTTIVVPESEEPVYVPEEPTQPAPTTPATITTSVIFTDHGHEIAGFPISGKEGETIPLAKVKEIIKNNMPKGYVLDMDLEKAWKEGKFIISAKHPIYINIVKTHRQMVLFIDKKGRIVKHVYVVVKEGQKFSKKFVGRLSRKHQPKGYKMTSYRKVAKHLDIFVSGKKTKATDYGKLVLYVGKGGKIIKRANINKTKNKFDKANAKKHLPNGYKQAGHKHINRHVDVWVNKK